MTTDDTTADKRIKIYTFIALFPQYPHKTLLPTLLHLIINKPRNSSSSYLLENTLLITETYLI